MLTYMTIYEIGTFHICQIYCLYTKHVCHLYVIIILHNRYAHIYGKRN